MPDTNKSKAAGSEGDDRKAKRRARLQSLGSRRANNAARAATPRKPDMAGDANVLSQGKAFARIYRVLTNTPADDKGMVEGTPFTHAGVVRLMDSLKSRAENEGQAGAKVAASILRFVSAKDGEADVHGASLERLQRIAKVAKNRI